VVPHFGVKWNSPLRVFKKYNGGTLNTLTNQANYHRLGRVLNSPPPMQDATCQSRGLVRGCNGAKVKGEK